VSSVPPIPQPTVCACTHLRVLHPAAKACRRPDCSCGVFRSAGVRRLTREDVARQAEAEVGE
jgi:hypothetical protein